MTAYLPLVAPLLALAALVLALAALVSASRAIDRRSAAQADTPKRSAQDYRAAIAAAEAYAEAAEPGTVRDAVWDRAYLQMLTAQGLAISTKQATGDAYPYGFALPAECLARFFTPGLTPWIVWSRDA